MLPGYIIQWGGLWEHLESGRNRLMIVVPVTFLLIFMLLFATFHSARLAELVFTGVPFAVTGGILALLLRGMPFSMSVARAEGHEIGAGTTPSRVAFQKLK